MNVEEAKMAQSKGIRFTLPKHSNRSLYGEVCTGKGNIRAIGENRPYYTADSQPPSYPAIQLACDGINCGIIFLGNLQDFPEIESMHKQSDSDFLA